MNIFKTKKDKGSAIVYALVIMTAVLIVLVSMINYIVGQLKFSYNRAEKEKAFQVSEAGIYYYRWYLAHETSGKTAQQIQDFWSGGGAIGVGSTHVQNYEGIGQYSLSVTPPSSGSTIITVVSEGHTFKMPGVKRTVKVRFRRPSWSEYVFLSNSFMNFGDQSEVWARFILITAFASMESLTIQSAPCQLNLTIPVIVAARNLAFIPTETRMIPVLH